MFAHELGHAMGFFHVPNGYGHAMALGEWTGRTDFSVKERQHARHAYQRSIRAVLRGRAGVHLGVVGPVRRVGGGAGRDRLIGSIE